MGGRYTNTNITCLAGLSDKRKKARKMVQYLGRFHRVYTTRKGRTFRSEALREIFRHEIFKGKEGAGPHRD